MSILHRKKLLASVAAVGALALLVSAGPSAWADVASPDLSSTSAVKAADSHPVPDPNTVDLPDEATYTPSAPGGVQTLGFPSNCGMRADNVHKSTHQPLTINAETQSQCAAGNWSSITQDTQLWETTWFGWTQIGTPGHYVGGVGNSAWTNATEQCRTGMTAKTTNNGDIVYGGTAYTAQAQSDEAQNIQC